MEDMVANTFWKGKNVFITGHTGFKGSWLAIWLHKMGALVTGYSLAPPTKPNNFELTAIEKDINTVTDNITDADSITKAVKQCQPDIVFHLAANPDVRLGAIDTNIHFQQNIVATYNLLEEMRIAGVKKIVFTSSSTVYGEASIIPTPENYGPLVPISLYGASKLAAEALITAYCHTFDMEAKIYRFANVVGPRSTHGVIYDFINKLRKNPKELEILGDGSQKKSYLYIDDCIDAMLFGLKSNKKVEIFNIGSEDWINVKKIAEIVSQEMNLNPKFIFTGGVDGRGWKGDVKIMRLAIDKLKKLGWKPRYNSEQAVRLTAKWMVENL